MPYLCDPVPDMESQKYGPWGLIHDLTCGRYCLKSLLKYWHEKAGMGHVTKLTLPDPVSRLRHWMGYDPWDDYQHSRTLLQQSNKPLNAAPMPSPPRIIGPLSPLRTRFSQPAACIGLLDCCSRVLESW